MPWGDESRIMRQKWLGRIGRVSRGAKAWTKTSEKKEATTHRSRGRIFQAERQQAQDPELRISGVFTNQKKPEWLKYNDGDTEWHEMTKKGGNRKTHSSTFT